MKKSVIVKREETREPKSAARETSTVISMRVSKAQQLELKALAEEAGQSLSDYLAEIVSANHENGHSQPTLFDGDFGEEARRLEETFVEGLAQSARSFARGWLKVKVAERYRGILKKAALAGLDVKATNLPIDDDEPF